MTNKIDDQKLYSSACELTSIANAIKILGRFISTVEYQRLQGDADGVTYQVQSGALRDVGCSLQDIEEAVQRISNEICPEVES
ncbi:hypothetical protein D922_01241 [Enterococcus faecalis 06-MB-DW-09]|nr:hypothetical protein D922_01241 [Enterococcus faecalis 06-MB-DW-09]